jgi:hypothetical protein
MGGNAKQLTKDDLGCTENEFSDLLIDMWKLSHDIEAIRNGASFTVMPMKGDIVVVAFVGGCFIRQS